MNEELTNMKEEIETLKMSSNCKVSSAASTGSGLGSGTFAGGPPSSLSHRWTELEGESGAEDNRNQGMGEGLVTE